MFSHMFSKAAVLEVQKLQQELGTGAGGSPNAGGRGLVYRIDVYESWNTVILVAHKHI